VRREGGSWRGASRRRQWARRSVGSGQKHAALPTRTRNHEPGTDARIGIGYNKYRRIKCEILLVTVASSR
jgi:hypothetical protein